MKTDIYKNETAGMASKLNGVLCAFFKWLKPSLYAAYLGAALNPIANIDVFQWEFYAIIFPTIMLVAFTRD